MTVVDANVLFKLIAKEENSDIARKAFFKVTSLGEPIEVPDLAVSEVLNVLWKSYILKKGMTTNSFEDATRQFDLILADLDVIPAMALKNIALNVSTSKRISVYDSMYIAASIFRGSSLMSFDKELIEKASQLGVRIFSFKDFI